MPYAKNTELPKAVRDALPTAAQSVFRNVVNSQLARGLTEERAFASGWAAVKRTWKKSDDGTWVRIKEGGYGTVDALAEALHAVLTEPLPLEEQEEEGEVLDDPESTDEAVDPTILIAQEAYQALAAVSTMLTEATEQETAKALLDQIFPLLQLSSPPTLDRDEPVNPVYAKEVLETLKVHQLRMDEAGQRHAAWEYKLIDDMIDMLKKLRGSTPSEAKAMDEAKMGSPERSADERWLSTVRESMEILREAAETGGAQWEVCIIQAGMSKNARTYPLPVLEAAAPLFDGARVYTYDRLYKGKEVFDHLSEEELQANPQGYAKDMVGFLKDPKVSGARLTATLVILDSADWLKKNLQRAFSLGQNMLYGLSIDAEGDGHLVEQAGQKIVHVDAIKRVRSVDVVTHPAAGGGFLRLLASYAMYPGTPETDHDEQMERVVKGLNQQIARLQLQLNLMEVLDFEGVPAETQKILRTQIMHVVEEYAYRLGG